MGPHNNSTMSDMQKITIKCKHRDDLRRRSIPLCNPLCRSPRLDLLVKSMAELFGLNEHTPLKLFWRDEDGDLITIESDCDVAEAFRNISATSAVLRLEMVADAEVVESFAGPVADVEETVIHSHNQNVASRADGEADEIVDQHMEDQSVDGASGETYDVDEPACGVCKSDPVVQLREHVHGAVVGAVEGAKVAMASAKEASQAAMAGLPAATRVVHGVSEGARGAIGEVVGVSKAVIATAPEAAKAVFANMTEVKNAVVAGMPQAQEQLLATVAKGSQAASDGAWMIRERLVRQMGRCSAGEEEEGVAVEFQSMVRALMDMGFSEAAARDAVLNSKGNMDAALELALQHVPPTPPEAALVKVAPEPEPEPELEPEPEVASWDAAWDPLLPELEEMGFLDTNSNRQFVVEHKGDLKNTVAALVRHERTKFQK